MRSFGKAALYDKSKGSIVHFVHVGFKDLEEFFYAAGHGINIQWKANDNGLRGGKFFRESRQIISVLCQVFDIASVACCFHETPNKMIHKSSGVAFIPTGRTVNEC